MHCTMSRFFVILANISIHSLTFLTFSLAHVKSGNADELGLSQTVDVYKCNGSELSAGYEIRVPSYPFDSHIILRISGTESFPGCGSSTVRVQLNETELFYVQDDQAKLAIEKNRKKIINSIESNKTSISPSGILNVKNHYYSLDEFCISEYTKRSETETPSLKIKFCPHDCTNEKGSQTCIRKCCPVGKVVDLNKGYRCEPSGNKSWTGFLYDQLSWKPAPQVENRNFQKPHYFKEFMSSYHIWNLRKFGNQSQQFARLLTNGKLIYITARRKWELLDTKTEFCMDGIQNFGSNPALYSGEEVDQIIFVRVDQTDEESNDALTTLYMYSLLFASIFYLATAIINLLIWDKQNTHGWTVFSFVLSQFFMCVFVGNAHRLGLYGNSDSKNSTLCVSNAILAHFFMLAPFTWLTVINFDLWSAFRSLKTRNHTALDFKKFAWYSVIGWGIPLTVVIVGIALDRTYPNRDSLVLVPEYGLSKCYIVNEAQGVYIYYIMAVLLGITVTLSVFTCAKIYEFHKDTADVRSSSNAGDRKIFSLYARLSIVLGTSWIFEFISWAASPSQQHFIFIILDMYNLLTSFLIFIIFACKQSNLAQLVEKYSCLRPVSDFIVNWRNRMPSEQSGSTRANTLSVRSSKNENRLQGEQYI